MPYCAGGVLGLFRLTDLDELAPGTLGIVEPKSELRAFVDRQVSLNEVDLVLVPGVAFDRRGGRLGHGQGYYDKLLAAASRDVPLVAPAFECQLFGEIPMLPHDVFMDKVVTEDAVYQGRRRPIESPPH